MPSLRSRTILLLSVVVCLTTVSLLSSLQSRAQESTTQISEQQAKQAMEALKKDPNLVEEQKIKTLHWVDKDKKKEEADNKLPGWLRWLRDLFVWLSHTSRFFLWTGIAILLGLIVIFLIRVFRNYQSATTISPANFPTHVRELDIRPESLPDDIGAAAWQLWQANEHRAALAMLYRGLLSRLVHQHAVPIKDSSTESQCLELARAHLELAQTDYVARTLRVWQFAVYGAQLPVTEQVQQLCEEFALSLNKPRHSMEHLR